MLSKNGDNLVLHQPDPNASRAISPEGVPRLACSHDFGRWPLAHADGYLNTTSSREGPVERRGRGSTWCVVLGHSPGSVGEKAPEPDRRTGRLALRPADLSGGRPGLQHRSGVASVMTRIDCNDWCASTSQRSPAGFSDSDANDLCPLAAGER